MGLFLALSSDNDVSCTAADGKKHIIPERELHYSVWFPDTGQNHNIMKQHQ